MKLHKILLGLVILGVIALKSFANDNLEQNFLTPPDSIKPKVYWYWINDNVSKDGVIKDLEAMHEVGIGGAYIGNIGEQDGDYGTVKLLSEPWWDITHAAVKRATELGMELGMFNSPGWSQSGGPWIKPEQSMRYLAYSEVNVAGPGQFHEKIASPGDHFQDVKVLAFPVPKENEKDINYYTMSLPAQKKLHVAYSSNVTMRSVSIIARQPIKATVDIQAMDDKEEFHTIKTFSFDRSNSNINVGFLPFAPVVISIPATTAEEFRLVFSDIRGKGTIDFAFSPMPRVESYAEKTLAKMWPTPLPLFRAYMWPDQPVVDDESLVLKKDQILDISENLKSDGTLVWDVPEGNWVIQRTGMLTTGVQNSPATPEAKGLEVDKMSKKHVAYHFDSYLGKILARIPAEDRKSLKVAVQDSYETGGQNWTDDMIEEFQKRYGYDPVPFIPVITTGRVVVSADCSDRFLWDLRRMVADRIAYDYVGGLRDVSNKHGLDTWLECYGHWGFPAEFLQYGGQSNRIGGEFWNEGDLGSIENRAASSCGHTYGKTIITAESFTAAGRMYERYPGDLKKRCDWSYTEGINETLLHLYIHQAYEDKTPGINAWFATEFNRKNTWFYEMKPFVQYMRRCMFMLQQGQNVADAAYFIGEDAPKMTGECNPPLPKGYTFDYINGETIRDRLSVENGKLVLPHGTSYSILVLPQQDTMRPEMLRKIKSLVEQGAVVLGPAPKRSPSLQNYPECDVEIQKLVAELWGGVDGKDVKYRRVGKGMILSGMTMEEAFDLMKLPADCKFDDPEALYVHRTLGNTEIYFVTNQVKKPIVLNPVFRVDGMIPELWDANTGEIRKLPAFVQQNGVTIVPMKLDALESAFIVFRQKGKPTASGEENHPTPQTVANVNDPWTVQFDAKLRGPEQPVTFANLEDWTTLENDAIKYYSGPATYTASFDLANIEPGKKILLNLGTVHVLAKVKVNGQDAGTVWTAPWQVDATKLVKQGTNQLEITVINPWANRLIGDAKLPESERPTWLTVHSFKPNQPLFPAGLIGPVTVQTVK